MLYILCQPPQVITCLDRQSPQLPESPQTEIKVRMFGVQQTHLVGVAVARGAPVLQISVTLLRHVTGDADAAAPAWSQGHYVYTTRADTHLLATPALKS